MYHERHDLVGYHVSERGDLWSIPLKASDALTADSQVLAIATNAVIRIYHKHSRQLKAELRGHANNVWGLEFVGETSGEYILLSYSSFVGNAQGMIVRWRLDSDGRPHHSSRIMPFATRSLTEKAMSAIEGDCWSHHDMTDGEVESVTKHVENALKEASTQHQTDGLPHVEGMLPGFGSKYISHDGKSFVYLIQNTSTQNGMRPQKDLPQAIVASTADLKTIHCLAGHQDSIMWASWSPDDNIIAMASWDRHFSIWDTKTGVTTQLIGPTTGQNWSGAFSPDSKHVLLSGSNPVKVAIYEVATGRETAALETRGYKGWVREVAWSPNPNYIAIVLGQTVVLWETGPGVQQEVFKLQNDGSMLDRYCKIGRPKWIDSGKKLAFRTTDSTIFVWDMPSNCKWRFQRPFGTAEDNSDGDMFWDPETRVLLSLDGDGVMRGWCLHGPVLDHGCFH